MVWYFKALLQSTLYDSFYPITYFSHLKLLFSVWRRTDWSLELLLYLTVPLIIFYSGYELRNNRSFRHCIHYIILSSYTYHIVCFLSLYASLASLASIISLFSVLDAFIMTIFKFSMSVNICILMVFPSSSLKLCWTTIGESHASTNPNVSPYRTDITNLLDLLLS